MLDNYQIQQVLGVGGFGITYKALDMTLDCLVAIKEYFPSHLAVRSNKSDQIMAKTRANTNTFEFGLQRFMDEARLLAKFTDQNIVRVRRYIEHNGSAYIIMDYEEGLPLSRYLMRCNSLSEDEVKLVFQPILSGLRAVHAMNFLHRDVKPPNIYLRTGGTAVLLDFGAARHAVNPGGHVTNLGTHFYAPFEQFTSSDPQGPWTDIFSLGATLFHCLTGRPPIPSLDRISAAHAKRRDPLPPATQLCKGRYSQDLLECVDWMLKLRIKDRPQSTEELMAVFTNTEGQAPAAGTILSKNDVDWNAELIRQAEQQLAQYLGPLAGMIVKRTMSKVTTVEQLYVALSRHIDSIRDRELFLKAVNAGASITSTLNRRNHAVTAPLAAPAKPPPEPTSRRLDQALTRQLEEQLAFHIGPMSRLLVRKAVEANYDLEQIIDILAKELPGEAEREHFRKQFAV